MKYKSLYFWLVLYWPSASENANVKPAEDVLWAVILEAANLWAPPTGNQRPVSVHNSKLGEALPRQESSKCKNTMRD